RPMWVPRTGRLERRLDDVSEYESDSALDKGVPQTAVSRKPLFVSCHLGCCRAGDAGGLGPWAGHSECPGGDGAGPQVALVLSGWARPADPFALRVRLLEKPASGEHRNRAGGTAAAGTGRPAQTGFHGVFLQE